MEMLVDTFVRFETLNYCYVHEMVGKLLFPCVSVCGGRLFYRLSCYAAYILQQIWTMNSFCECKHHLFVILSYFHSKTLLVCVRHVSSKSSKIFEYQKQKTFMSPIGFIIILFENSHNTHFRGFKHMSKIWSKKKTKHVNHWLLLLFFLLTYILLPTPNGNKCFCNMAPSCKNENAQ